MGQKPGRGIPKFVVGLVALAVLGTSFFVVSLASRSSKKAQPKDVVATRTRTASTGGDSFLTCTNCHGDLDKVFKQGRVPTLLYRHEKHFAKGVSDCAQCHSAVTHATDTINKPTMARCFVCHGLTTTAIAPGKCGTCHPPGMPDRPQSHLNRAGWLRGHGAIAKTDAFQCAACHEQKFCNACHGLELPHPDGWKGLPHAQTFFATNGTPCLRCHARGPEVKGRDSCDRCHHPKGPQTTPWRKVHPTIVKTDGARDCFGCHNPVTCATCHVNKKEDFSGDQLVLNSPSPTPSPSSQASG